MRLVSILIALTLPVYLLNTSIAFETGFGGAVMMNSLELDRMS